MLSSSMISSPGLNDKILNERATRKKRGTMTRCGTVLRTTKIYVSLAHSEDDLAQALDVFAAALAAVPRRPARPSNQAR